MILPAFQQPGTDRTAVHVNRPLRQFADHSWPAIVNVEAGPDGLAITLPEGTDRDAIAEINRVLVEGGIPVYRLEHIQASLESWFLEVTSRLGGPE